MKDSNKNKKTYLLKRDNIKNRGRGPPARDIETGFYRGERVLEKNSMIKRELLTETRGVGKKGGQQVKGQGEALGKTRPAGGELQKRGQGN